MSKTLNSLRARSRTRGFARSVLALAALSLSSTFIHAALPVPIVELRFSEGAGATTANAGSLGGSASLAEANAYPVFTNLVPTGPFAPSNNALSVDFGPIAAGQGGRAVDLATADQGTLGPLNAFTICGWLNARDLNEGWGGNRVAFALESPNGPGFDLVQLANGALRIGVNQWPDGENGGGPSSSPGMLKADSQAGAGNWVYFAASYDPALESGNLKYFFGGPAKLAAPDTAHSYKGGIDNGGIIESSGALTIGNFSGAVSARDELGSGGGSRVFRGLVDEVKIYDRALELAEIQQAQLNGALPPVAAAIAKPPANLTVFVNQSATFKVQVDGTAPFAFQWQRNGVDIPGATNESHTIPAATSADNGAQFRVRVGNALASNLTSEPATLTVLSDNGHKVSLSFSEGGSGATNLGNLQGYGVFAVAQGFPETTINVPNGAFAPADNVASVDFGGIAAGQGGRAIDLTNQFDNTLGPLTAFTASGWLNCRDANEGWGGNRIVFALATPGGAGFDLVQLANGALRVGINEWPDASPGGPASTEGKITVDSETGAANWVFFAVTYDSALDAGNLSFYFGAPNQTAQLDYTADYSRGAIAQTGPLTVGNFSTVVGARAETGPGGGSRCFRGLIDEINVFGKALALADIQALQVAPAFKPATVDPVAIRQDPQSQTNFAGQSATFRVKVGGTPPLRYQWWRKTAGTEAAVDGATNASYSLPRVATSDNGSQFWVIVANSIGFVASQRADLTVLAENNHKVSLSFSEGSGVASGNLGNLGGFATLVQSGNFPQFSTLTPSGAYAPAGNQSSVDFGPVADGEGGRSVDLTTTVTPTLGQMQAFTLTGWLNCRDLQYGPGGNRILYCQTAPGSGGFDLVQQADGVLWMGVNAWPDGPQTVSSAMSSPRVTADPSVGNENWVFFAVTYDGASAAANTSFYFGSPSQAATLDITVDYDMGVIESVGQLTFGNFSVVDAGARNATGAGNSRCFRGLMDELNVFNKALTLEEIQKVQKAPAGVPAAAPILQIRRAASTSVELGWESASAFQLQTLDRVQTGDWTDVTTPPSVAGNRSTVAVAAGAGTRFFRLRGK